MISTKEEEVEALLLQARLKRISGSIKMRNKKKNKKIRLPIVQIKKNQLLILSPLLKRHVLLIETMKFT